MTFSIKYFRHFIAGMTSLGVVLGWGATIGTLAVATATPASACNDEPYIGSLCTFSFDWCPSGYLRADGRTVQIRDYQALFALINFKYGGDNKTIFGLPNLSGRSIVGVGQGQGSLLPFQPVNWGQSIGQQALLLSLSQVPLVPHTHAATFEATSGGSQSVTIPPSPSTLGVTSKLQAVQATGSAQPQTGSQLGMGGSGSQQAPIYVASPTTATAVDLGGLEVKLTGSAGHGPLSFSVPTGITGGNVSLQPAVANPTSTISTQSPGLGMTVCIAADGDFPQRP